MDPYETTFRTASRVRVVLAVALLILCYGLAILALVTFL